VWVQFEVGAVLALLCGCWATGHAKRSTNKVPPEQDMPLRATMDSPLCETPEGATTVRTASGLCKRVRSRGEGICDSTARSLFLGPWPRSRPSLAHLLAIGTISPGVATVDATPRHPGLALQRTRPILAPTKHLEGRCEVKPRSLHANHRVARVLLSAPAAEGRWT
jgi:hypothetical protein